MASKVGPRLGTHLRARREARGLTQAQLAERVGVSENYLSAVERGVKVPTLETLEQLAKGVGVEPGDLLGLSAREAWLEELLAVAQGVPKPLRPVALDVLRAIAGTRSRRG
jgi:transcriptional regulator with XRE-family HTH domain